MKKAIHTTIKYSTKKRLLEYGKGVLNEGIEAVVEIADRQEVTGTRHSNYNPQDHGVMRCPAALLRLGASL